MLDCKYFDSLLLQASIMHEDSAEKQIDDIFRNIEANLSQKPPRKNLEADVNKDLKKIRKYFPYYSASSPLPKIPSSTHSKSKSPTGRMLSSRSSRKLSPLTLRPRSGPSTRKNWREFSNRLRRRWRPYTRRTTTRGGKPILNTSGNTRAN